MSVSPDPVQALLAAVVVLNDGVKKLRIYDYRTNELKQEFELDGKINVKSVMSHCTRILWLCKHVGIFNKQATVAFHPYGE